MNKFSSVNKAQSFFLTSSIVFIFLMIILRESILNNIIETTIFNFFILITVVSLLFFYMKLTEKILIFQFLIIIVLFSTLINASNIEKGGYVTLFLFFVSLIMLSFKFVSVDIQKLNKAFLVTSLLFIIVLYTFYFLGIQLIPAHISYILAGPFVNQNTTSMILLGLFTMLVMLNSGSRLAHLLIFVLFISIFLTQSRAALFAALILFLFFYRKKILIFIPFFAILVLVFVSQVGDFSDRLLTKFSEAGTSHRVEFWLTTFSTLADSLESLLFGFGANVYRAELNGSFLSVHNSYVNFIGNYGLASFTVLVFLLTYILYDAFRYSQLLFVALLSLLFHGFWETVLFSGFSMTWMVFILLYAMREQLSNKRISSAHFNHTL